MEAGGGPCLRAIRRTPAPLERCCSSYGADRPRTSVRLCDIPERRDRPSRDASQLLAVGRRRKRVADRDVWQRLESLDLNFARDPDALGIVGQNEPLVAKFLELRVRWPTEPAAGAGTAKQRIDRRISHIDAAIGAVEGAPSSLVHGFLVDTPLDHSGEIGGNELDIESNSPQQIIRNLRNRSNGRRLGR